MLKKNLFICCLLISMIGFSQEKIQTETPLILKKLIYLESVSVDNYTVKFSEVVSDSRCPKNVTCVWAGEVVFELQVYKYDQLLTTETFEIPPTGYSVQERKSLIIEGKPKLYLYNVLPFPKAEKTTEKTDYYLQFSSVD